MATATEKAPAAAKAAEKLTLEQKFVKLREAVPTITQQAHSDGVKYKFAKIFDVYKLLTPAMNKWGVNFDIISEVPTRHDENGNALYYHSYTQQTRNGSRIVWVYEADLTIRWTNADDPADALEVTLHALGTNDGGPDKAKGSAWTYCLKYYLFEKFGIDQGDDDPDMNDHSSEAPPQQQTRTSQNRPADAGNRATEPRNGGGGRNTQPPAENAGNRRTDAPKPLSDAQLSRMYRKGEAAGYAQAKVDKWIGQKYGVQEPRNMTRAQYDEICAILDENAIQGGNQ